MQLYFFSVLELADQNVGIANDRETGVPDTVESREMISATIEMLTSTSIAFLIFSSVMLGSFIVSSYKNKTMSLMFSYPIKRQKILAWRPDCMELSDRCFL